MLKDNTTRNFSEHIIPIIKDYLATVYFITHNNPVPKVPDLYDFIVKGSDHWAFTDYLIENIHRFIYVETFADEIKTAISLHLQDMKDRKIPIIY